MSAHRSPLSSSPLMEDTDEWDDNPRARTNPRINTETRAKEATTPPASASTRSGRVMSAYSEGLQSSSSSVSRQRTKTDTPKSDRTSNEKKGKKVVPVLRPEGRRSIENHQRREAEMMHLRTMGRIGELYMEGLSNPPAFPVNDKENEDESDGSASSREREHPDDENLKDVNSDGFIDVFSEIDLGVRQRTAHYYTGFNDSTVDDTPRYERNDAVTGRRDNIPSERVDRMAGSAVPNTVLRKNITQRRSHGHPKDRVSLGTSIPVSDLLSKKPIPRNRDIVYSSEVTREVEVAHEPPLPSRPATPPIPDFTRKDMRLDSPNPEANRRLQQLWVQKKEVEEDMQHALELGDEHHYRSLESQHANINSRMFEIRHAAMRPSKPDATTDTLTGWNYDGSSYVIYLAYQDRLIPWVVWSHIPVALLVQATVSALALSGIVVTPDEILLFHDNTLLDPVSGQMSDQPVLRDDIVSVYLTARGGINLTRNAQPRDGDGNTPHPDQNEHERSFQRNPQRHDPLRGHHIPNSGNHRNGNQRNDSHREGFSGNHRNGNQRNNSHRENFNRDQHVFSPSKPHQMMGGRNDYDGDRSSRSSSLNGEERDESLNTSRAHDKIKQNFKCPRFSGLTKDWKLWDKGFQRYLSIWDLDYVLQPDFFDEVPFPQSKIKDNKLVYLLYLRGCNSGITTSFFIYKTGSN
jgi:hypothetical protein